MTAYYARVLENDVDLALDVIAGHPPQPVFAEDEIEVERGVILQEIGRRSTRRTTSSSTGSRRRPIPTSRWADDPGRGRAGERLRQGGPADLRGRALRPGQMILCAAGAVDHDAICRAAETLFGHLPPSCVPR
jgi:predicted Zn-dependent peptidase